MKSSIKKIYVLLLSSLFLSACSNYAGIRTPRYDGEPFEVQPKKIAVYNESREIIGEEKAHFLPESFSSDMLNPSLDYNDYEPILLEEGTFIIGEDIPAGRVNIIGQKEDPNLVIGSYDDPFAPPRPDEYRVGTMTIRDKEGKLYFENMFHPFYGVMITQVDFIEGHRIHIVGSSPEIVVFYNEKLPNDPYVFDTRWEEYLAELTTQEGYVEMEPTEVVGESDYLDEQEQAITNAEENIIDLKAGIYEVGIHLGPGLYELTEESAPTYTELYIFSGDEEPRVIEISENLYALTLGWGQLNAGDPEVKKPTFELYTGDKIYPHYVNRLRLTKIK